MLTFATKQERNALPALFAPSGHHARRVLAVRALAAQLDWLENAAPHWTNDRIAWRLPDGSDRYPEGADLARAQQRLYKTRQYPQASRTVFADPDAWRGEMQKRLILIGRLRHVRLIAADAVLLQNPAQLLALLPAEALCVFGDLPGPPSRALVALAAAGRATPDTIWQIAAMTDDAELPAHARTLAALTLGAMERYRRGVRKKWICHTALSPLVRPAFDQGLHRGLPEQASLVAALYAVGGAALAERGERLLVENAPTSDLELPLPFPIAFALLRETLLRGGNDAPERAQRLIEVMELLKGRGGIVSRLLLQWRHEIAAAGLDAKDRRRKSHLRCKDEAHRLRTVRAEASREVAERFEQVLRVGMNQPDLVALTERTLQFAEILLTLSPPSNFVLETLRNTLEQCLLLQTHLRADFFGLACEQSGAIWCLPQRVQREPSNSDTVVFSDWRQNQWLQEGGRLRTILQTIEDADLIREAIHLGIYEAAVTQISEFAGDAKHLRLLVRLTRQFRPDPPHTKYCSFLSALQETLRSFATGKAARTALWPLERALLSAVRDPKRRPAARRVLAALLNAPPSERAERHQILPRLATVVPQFLRWAESADDDAWAEHNAMLASAAVWSVTETLITSEAFFGAVVATVPACLPASSDFNSSEISLLGIKMAAALAGDNIERFTAFILAATSQVNEKDTHGDQDWLTQGIALLKQFPGLTAPLAALFPSQPRRCVALLRQIGRAAHLGSDVLAPLADCVFEPAKIVESDDPGWQAVLALDPAFTPLVADLWRAQWLLALPPDVPPGVRRILEEKGRRSDELDYLETLCETQSPTDAPGLFVRRDNLRVRLLTDGVRADTAGEIGERLRQVAVEAKMSSIEQQAALCFRERLRQMVGPLPSGLTLTPDLENATLLSFTITRNRKPLLKFLRAVISNESNPFENHPENAAFRQRLADAGVDVNAWRESAPCRVRVPSGANSPTQTLRLTLETDPLQVLQMGNYFGTCLSAGSGFNAFSTVANALEQNKRVLYVRDEAGHIMARKLIGISTDGAMVGFYTYCFLSKETGGNAVRSAVCQYLSNFAAHCGLSLADTGTVPTLFCEGWYDDGVVPWRENEVGESGPNNQSGGQSIRNLP